MLLIGFAGFLLACTTVINTQPTKVTFTKKDPFADAWRKIDSLQNQGLPKSAQTAVEELLVKARAQKSADQIIKCHLYSAKFIQQLNEEGAKKGINHLEAELLKADEIEKALLYSILGEVYTQYLNNSRWKINQRTELSIQSDDILTWTTNQFIAKSKDYFLKSLAQGKWLALPIDKIEFVLAGKLDEKTLRPTVLDFLAHRAIDHFSNTQNLITEPTNVFLLNDPKVFGSTEEFLNINFDTENKNSGIYQGLLIIQKLVKHHKQLGNKEALMEIERKRLLFSKSNAVLGNKDELFLDGLRAFVKKYESHENAGDFLYEIANYHFNKANSQSYDYKSRDADAFIEAKKMAETCIDKYPKSWGADHSKSILFQIKQKQLELHLEEAVTANKDFLVGMTFRNLNNLVVKIFPYTEQLKSALNKGKRNEDLRILNNADPLKSWTINPEFKTDYYQHRSEFAVDKLPYGQYLITVAESENFNEKEIYKRVVVTVTDISVITQNNNTTQQKLLVVNRESGVPMAGVKVEQWVQKRTAGITRNVKMGEQVSDKNGAVAFKLSRNTSYQYKYFNGQDRFEPNNRYYGRGNVKGNRNYERTAFFLDRKIYRPGQTIFFKGIVMNIDGDRKPEIIPNRNYEVNFFDANRQKISAQTLQTNEFGSFQGTFVAPEGGLLGNFSISTNSSNVNFRVEEYKRPKFEVEINKPTTATNLNESIEITGSANAFAGYPIDGAKVSYRVTRQASFPWCPWWRIPSYYNRSQAEISNGEVKTDDDGKFIFSFKTLPDQTILEADQPEYRFVITADVTDGSGETRSSSFSLRAGTIGFTIGHNLSAVIEEGDLDKIIVQTKNLNGQFIPIKVEAKLLQLDKPKAVIKNRTYEVPDINLLEKGEFEKRFPLLAYGDEAQAHTWNVKKESWKETWTSVEDEKKALPKGAINPGTYKLILTGTDSSGKLASQESIIEIYSKKGGVIPGTNDVWLDTVENEYKVGEEFKVAVLANSATSVFYQLVRNNEILSEGWKNINLTSEISKLITEADKGNFFLNLNYVKYNRFFSENRTIKVPWSDKILNITTNTFRDKLKPGAEETWSFKIAGEQKDKVAAEVVAAMYDASLDAFSPNTYGLDLWPSNYSRNYLQGVGFGMANQRGNHPREEYYNPQIRRIYPRLNTFGYYPSERIAYELESMSAGMPSPRTAQRKSKSMEAAPMSADLAMDEDASISNSEAAIVTENSDQGQNNDAEMQKDNPVRTNLNETVFFLPQLRTDEKGDLSFSFTMNEALTSWKLLLQAHDKELRTGTLTKEVVTQKELMVIPNPPRFFREGDRIEFSAKVVNLTEKPMNGSVFIDLKNALNEEDLNTIIQGNKSQSFGLEPRASASFSWTIDVPTDAPPITHKVIAQAGNFSDGEQEDRPVLTNRMMVTETFPMPVRAGETRQFDFKRITEVQQSTSAKAHQYSIEFTSNPAWYAVLALPYLMEYPHDCSEQIFSRYYANAIAGGIANKYPKIKAVFDKWENTDALLSNLSKNEDLKSALLTETPWVLQAQSEEEQRKNIGLLFNLAKLGNEQKKAISKLAGRQENDGGFAWFKEGRTNAYMTEYILTGFQRLKKMGFSSDDRVPEILRKGLRFIDQSFITDYNKLKERLSENGKNIDPEKQYIGHRQIHYLFARSFFDEDISSGLKEAYDFYQAQAEKYWMKFGLQNQAQIALIMNRTNRKSQALDLLKSFRERALHHEELGMYWKMDNGFYWYNNSLETHAFMINCLQEVDPQQRELEDLQTYLLKNKQTNAWETTKSTALAIYALLMTGEQPGSALAESKLVNINIGSNPLVIDEAEAGTGYFRKNYDATSIPDNAGKIKIENPNKNIAWGATYFQYFENLDKITTFEETPLTIKKEVFLEEKTVDGPKLKAIDQVILKPGNRLKVRIEIRVDREMEFVHLKDHRASGLEPENVLSQYKYQGSLGYYESTMDASTNFFISYLPKGTHVFEYPLRVVHKGDFSNGITTIQSMYAPEFSSHSEGVRIKVGD